MNEFGFSFANSSASQHSKLIFMKPWSGKSSIDVVLLNSYEVRKFGRCTNLVNQTHQDQAIVKVSQEHHIFGDIILYLFYYVFEYAFILFFSRSNAILT
ncbi:hypothetical protein MtrunA17_Chr4g0075401 [Medicago truncatula]|uniref:Transmembrane protein n=1 Tax=Medicago truncatula TaxID=3880 RepID=A0A396IJL6_MEDTR|nr:hypothetical protein MtrunA17_Chr4g0075401 [Medicago truncatula]